MITSYYIKMISKLETKEDRSKILRLWALNLSNEVAKVVIWSNISQIITEFFIKMASHDITDEVYLITAIHFMEDNYQKDNFNQAFKIICASNTLDSISIAEKVLTLSPLKADAVVLIHNTNIQTKKEIIDYIIESDDDNKVKAVCYICSAKVPLPEDLINHYIFRIKDSSSSQELEEIVSAYNNYAKSTINFNSNLYSLPTSELLNALEASPDFFYQELTSKILELALLRQDKCQSQAKK